MLNLSDVYAAFIVLGLAAVASEVMLSTSHWRANLESRAKLILPLWIFLMGIYLAYRILMIWGTD